MQVYLVGGAVRDKRLGLPVRERDWVVVGSTPQEMRQLGYTPVGKDFPVFLHPETKDEYALARTERKTGHGYTGFETCADPGITLEQDLLRRDLTINAMAETPAGELIDPYGGEADLENGVLRHVSPAFAEDPVRILRVARFAARFAHWGFRVAHGTNRLMRDMVNNGEVDHLVPERVWAELLKALAEKTPARFFAVLHGCGALARLFPEIGPLYRERSDGQHGHTGTVLPVLEQSAGCSEQAEVRFAALIRDICNHEADGFDLDRLAALCERLRVPNTFRELGGMALQYCPQARSAAALDARQQLELLESLDAFRRPERFSQFLQVCAIEADTLQITDSSDVLGTALAAARSVDASALQRQGHSGKALGDAIRQARIEAIAMALQAAGTPD
jgi:tRNA nucleotidyltransferase (CCA-adding enzyme)